VLLHSPAIQRFERAYHRASIINDGGAQTVPHYDENIIGLQEYLGGKALIAYMDSEAWGTTLNLYFFSIATAISFVMTSRNTSGVGIDVQPPRSRNA